MGELEDNLYEVSQRLEDELERVATLEEEKRALLAQLEEASLSGQHNGSALREAQQQLGDMLHRLGRPRAHEHDQADGAEEELRARGHAGH